MLRHFLRVRSWLTFSPRDKKHVDWVRSYLSLIDELYKYVQEYFKMGLVWNPKVCPLRFSNGIHSSYFPGRQSDRFHPRN